MISWRRLPWTAHDWPSGRQGAGGRQNLQPARKTGWGDRLIFEPPDMNRTADARDCGDVTQLLRAWSAGDAGAIERVLPLVYEELHQEGPGLRLPGGEIHPAATAGGRRPRPHREPRRQGPQGKAGRRRDLRHL